MSAPRPALRTAAGVAAAGVGFVVLDRLAPHGAPMGIVLLGVVIGSLQALTAAGIVLVHRATGVLNLAQAELGAAGGVLALELVLRWRVPYLLAVPAGLATAFILGATADLLVMRRFRDAPRMVAIVVTIGLAETLGGSAQALVALLHGGAAGRFAFPLSLHLSVFPMIFNADHVVAVVVVGAAFAGLAWFLRATRLGTALRAVGDHHERARLIGLPAVRLSALAWGLAGALSAAAVMLRAPVVGFTSIGSITGGGVALLLRATAAAVIGRMERLPRTVIAAIAIGVFDQVAFWNWSTTTPVDVALVVGLFVVLLRQRASSVESVGARWQAVREVRPIPPELLAVPLVRWVRLGVRVLPLAVALALPLCARPSQEYAAAIVTLYALLAVSLVPLAGWTGQVSLAQFSIAGVGGAVTGVLVSRHGVDLFVALLAGAAVGAVVTIVVALPALRVTGAYVAVTTLGFGVVAYRYLLTSQYVPWLVPEQVDRPRLLGRLPLDRDWQMYLLCLAVLVAGMAVVANLRRSRLGRVAIAVRDNPRAAAAAGVTPVRAQVASFATSGAVAGLAGGLYVLQQNGLRTGAFAPEVSIRLFSMAVIGGLGSVPGAVLGAVYVRGAELLLSPGWAQLASGLGIVVLLMVAPEGLGGLVYRARDALLRVVARRAGVATPSLLGQEVAA